MVHTQHVPVSASLPISMRSRPSGCRNIGLRYTDAMPSGVRFSPRDALLVSSSEQPSRSHYQAFSETPDIHLDRGSPPLRETHRSPDIARLGRQPSASRRNVMPVETTALDECHTRAASWRTRSATRGPLLLRTSRSLMHARSGYYVCGRRCEPVRTAIDATRPGHAGARLSGLRAASWPSRLANP